MGSDLAPVITARGLLAQGIDDELVSAHVASIWPLDDVDVRAAVAAAHVLLRRSPIGDSRPGSERDPDPRAHDVG